MIKGKKHCVTKKTVPQEIGSVIAFVLFTLYAAFILFFFLFAILIAIKADNKAYLMDKIKNRVFCIPENPTFKNFTGVFKRWEEMGGLSYGKMLINSIWISLLGPLIAAFVTATVTYVLVFYSSKVTRMIYKLGVFVSILPIYGAAGAMYKLLTDIKIINSPLMFLTRVTLFGGNFFYYYAFYKAISWQYAEAAFIDGAGHWQVYLKIMLPMVIPSATALYVMGVIGTWNDYSTILLYWQKYPTLAYGAYAYSEGTKFKADTPSYFAGVLVSIIPILVLFGCFQNTVMEKVHIGGLKG